MKTYEINGKSLQVGRDVFELDDISEMIKVSEDYLSYQIDVMTARRNNDAAIESRFTSSLSWLTVPFPHWNWENYKYRVVPEPTYAQLQAKWVEENDVKVGDKVKHRVFGSGEIVYIEFDKVLVKYDEDEDENETEMSFQVLELVPEPQYRPYCFNDDLLNKIVISKNRDEKYSITGQKRNYVYMNDFAIEYAKLMRDFTWLDGSPCGVKI